MTCCIDALTPEQLPNKLKGIEYADDTGLIVNAKIVTVPGHRFIYNASLVEMGENFALFFREDEPTIPPFISHLGVIRLNADFDPIDSTATFLDTKSPYSEDPRAFWCEDRLYVSFVRDDDMPVGKRVTYLAQVNPTSWEVCSLTSLDPQINKIEKNWTPFFCNGSIHYLYLIYPRKIFEVTEEAAGSLLSYCTDCEQQLRPKDYSCWRKEWGQLRGGTPAVRISDQEYLAFFHSAFPDEKGKRWYVMGAYTFDAHPPHAMKRISSEPILFHGIYDTWTYHRVVRCVFPTGLVVQNDKVIVSCGENDTAVKIVTFDKEKLLESLVEAVPPDLEKFSLLGKRVPWQPKDR